MCARAAFILLCLCLLQVMGGHALSRRLLEDLGRKEEEAQQEL